MRKYLFAIITLCLFLILFSNSAKASAYYNGSIGLIRNSTWSYNLTGAFHSSLAWGDVDNDGDLDLISTGCISGGDASCTGVDKTRIYINNGTTLTENQTWQQNLTGVGWGSLAWGDVDNDGDLDLAVMGYNTTSGIVRIYINNGTTLTENQTWQQNLTGVDAYGGSIIFGDVNKDGKLDIALVGAYPAENNGIYTNNGTAFIKNSTWLQELPFVGYGQGLGVLVWGDVDNDGDLDLLFSGSRTTNFYRSVYINNGTSLVENSTWQQNLGLWGMPSITLGDFDNDGKLDLDYIGSKSGDHHGLYKNNGTTFILNQSEETAWLTGLFDGSIAFGDYDNDGDLDLVAMGKESGRDSVFNNNETFFQYDATARADFRTDDMQQGSLAWGDVDNDGDLDLISTGKEGDTSTFLTKVYVNNASTSNIVPNPPTSFNSSYANGQLTLTWGNGSDTETNTSGLYYNLRIGTTSGGNDIVSGVYGGGDDNGYFGNMMQRKSITLNVLLSSGQTIYWSVQTIDTGLAKSTWSTEQNYTASTDTTKPTIILNNPVDNYNTTNATILFNATVYDNGNLTNVTLYGSWGGWHVNETNSSGINNTDYIFTKNLTVDGDYTWQIRAYDNSTNYQLSSIRTFTIDTSYPVISLISPASSSTWSSSNTVTFIYNVSDVRIVNCSLIINDIADQTDSSITVNTEQSFTKSLSNGNYNWNINCTDTVGYTNSSGTRALTVNYVTPPSGGSGWVYPSTKGNVSEPANNTLTEENASEVSIVSTEENTMITLPSIEAGKTMTAIISKEVEAGVNQLSIQVRNAVKNIQIIIRKIASLPPAVPELKGVYKYIAIDKENITDDDISNMTITFSVNKSWIISNNINESTIILQRYTTQWERLTTVKTNESDSEISFEAQSTGFSYFAITGEVIKIDEKNPEALIVLVAAILITMLFVGLFYFRKKNRI
jgi:PGF-pre-PGF domain-containing protein